MSINLLYGCCQIETTARDLSAVRRFMVDVLDAAPIEQELARQIADLIPGDQYDVDHLDCGGAVFQINQPSATMTYNGRRSVHQAYLDRVGPTVTNLNFFVDDYAHAHDLLTALGAEPLIKGPSSAARALADYGPENTRPGADERPFLFMGSRHLIGLDLEIMEPNFLHFSRQSVQFPAFVHPRPTAGRGDLRLERLIIAVTDLQATYDNLAALFLPACISKPYGIREGSRGRAFRIALGGIEIEYCTPSCADGDLKQFLTSYGPGVFAIEFGADDPAAVLERARSWDSLGVEVDFDPLGKPHTPRHRIGSRHLAGFDVLVGQAERVSL